jgi:hypothetical protein
MGSDAATVRPTFQYVDKASDQQPIKERLASDIVNSKSECDVIIGRQGAIMLCG